MIPHNIQTSRAARDVSLDDGQDFRPAIPSLIVLPSLGMSKVNESFDLRDGKCRKSFLNFVHTIA